MINFTNMDESVQAKRKLSKKLTSDRKSVV